MNSEMIRAYFEKENGDRSWFKSDGAPDTSCDEGFVYEDYGTDMCWTTFFSGWKSSRESLVVELPIAAEYDDPSGASPAISDCRKAIHAAGVKTK